MYCLLADHVHKYGGKRLTQFEVLAGSNPGLVRFPIRAAVTKLAVELFVEEK
jgi:hypothetical protein